MTRGARGDVAQGDDGFVASIRGLIVDFRDGEGWANVLDGVDLSIPAGASVGLVGESGCGKTTTAFALLGYRRPGSRIRAGSARVIGQEVLGAGWGQLERLRGRHVGFVPQNPTVALNPRLRVGAQIDETLRCHRVGGSSAARRARILDLFERVGLAGGRRAVDAYPHQLSGGQQQRVMIALALSCDPQLVVLDEPTTGLDVTTQAQILDLLRELRATLGMAMLYVTHDLGVVAEICDSVSVMYAGHVVEEASTLQIFDNPRHPYTRGLLAAIPRHGVGASRPKPLKGLLRRRELPVGCRFAPRCEYARPRCFEERQTLEPAGPDHRAACWRKDEIPAPDGDMSEDRGMSTAVQEEVAQGEPLLRVTGLDCSYVAPRRWRQSHRASSLVVHDVSIEVHRGETLALVGETGSGKSTIARALAGILEPVTGTLSFGGRTIRWPVRQRARDLQRSVQLVLQNPDVSLNPRQRVEKIVGRPLELYFALRGERRESRLEELLSDVRLDAHLGRRFPSALSGGERQRVAIARALAAKPDLLLCDEILSALDVSVQAEVLDLMRRLQERDGTAYLFISHDLNVVRSIAHRVAVLYHGELCEIGLTDELYEPPSHPYTSVLLSSVPGEASGARTRLRSHHSEGSAKRVGCPLAAVCPKKLGAICEEVEPPWRVVSPTHAIRCHIPISELLESQPSSIDDSEITRGEELER